MPTNVRDLGAKGDGSDATSAFEKAFKIRGTPVFIPSGNYLISRPLDLLHETDVYGEDASSSVLIYEVPKWESLSASERKSRRACLRISPASGASNRRNYISLSKFRIEPHSQQHRLDLSKGLGIDPGTKKPYSIRQTAMVVESAINSFIIREVRIQDFFQGIELKNCWTARILECTIERCLLHSIKWENANAGEITSCRLDNYHKGIAGVTPEDEALIKRHGGQTVFVSCSMTDETLALGVTNNSIQRSCMSGFYARGVGNLTLINNFFEGNCLDNKAGAIYLGPLTEDEMNSGRPGKLYVANIIGGFFTPNGGGKGPCIKVDGYAAVNIIGVQNRGYEKAKLTNIDEKKVTGCINVE